jgi:DNA topoisomerase IA
MVTVLMVAEKPSLAQSIAEFLSHGQVRGFVQRTLLHVALPLLHLVPWWQQRPPHLQWLTATPASPSAPPLDTLIYNISWLSKERQTNPAYT